jgi:hypothetical protein
VAEYLAGDGVVVAFGEGSTKSHSAALDSLSTIDRANANKAAQCDRILREMHRRREGGMRLEALAAQLRILERREQELEDLQPQPVEDE